MRKIFRDAFENKAIIESEIVFPYKGATKKTLGYRLMIFAEYDNNFLYHVSVYESEIEAIDKLMTVSNATWEEI